MKKWAMMVTSVFVIMFMSNNTNVVKADSMDTGRLELTFLVNDANEYTPVDYVTVNIYYNTDNGYESITDLEEFSNIDLVLQSNDEGKVIIEGLPYGAYKYDVVTVPSDYRLENTSGEFYITAMEKEAVYDIYLNIEEELIEATTLLEEETEENVEDNTTISSYTYTDTEVIADENNEALTVSLNTLSTDMYSYNTTLADTTDDTQEATIVADTSVETEESAYHKVVKKTVNRTKNELTKTKRTVIDEMIEYKLNDAIKVVADTTDHSTNSFMDKVSSLPEDDKNKIKKINFKETTLDDVHKAKRYENITVNYRNRIFS